MTTALTYSRGRVAVPTIESGTLIAREAGQFAAPLLSCPVRASAGHRLRLPVSGITPERGALLLYLDPDHDWDAPEQSARGRLFSWLTEPGTGDLTASGTEVTDSVRAAGTSGDGLMTPAGFGIWPAATNLVTSSWDWSQWGVSEGSASVVTAGDSGFGRQAALVTATGAGSQRHTVKPPNLTAVAGTTYTISGYAKAGTTTFLVVQDRGDAVTHQAFFTLNGAGSVSNPFNATGTIRPAPELGAGWYRLTLTFTRTNSGSMQAAIGPTADAGNTIFTQSGESVSVNAWQAETGSIATPYIPTNGVTASRGAGRVQISTNGLCTPTQGAVFVRLRAGHPSAASYPGAGAESYVFSWRDDNNNRIGLAYGAAPSSRWQATRLAGGSGGALNSADSFQEGDARSLLMAWTATELRFGMNGASQSSVANSAVPALSATSMEIGTFAGSSAHLAGNVRWLVCFGGTPSDTDHAALHAFGDTPPTVADLLAFLSSSAVPTAFWDGATTTYISTLPSGIQAWLDATSGQFRVRRHVAGAGPAVSTGWTPSAGEPSSALLAWDEAAVYAAADGGAIASASNTSVPDELPDSFDLGSVGGTSDYLDAGYGAVAELTNLPAIADWQAFAGLRSARPPLLGERVNGAMTGLWYGANPFGWALPTGATVLDLVNTAGVRFDRLLGAGTAPVEHRGVETPLRDGKLYITSRLKERRLIAKLVLQGDSVASWYALRRELMAALTPRSGEGVLMYAPSQAVYEIDALLHSGLGIDDAEWLRGERPSVAFDCLDPAWRNTAQAASLQSVPLSGWSVPWSLPWPFTASAQTFVLTNDGDLPTYPVFTVTAGGNGATGVAFSNAANGKRYQTASGFVLAADETLTVDMDARTATTQDGSNQISQRTSTSEMWPLEVGENTVTISTDSGSATVQVGYRRRYVGV